ncbi:MAG TPA: YdeI/OmpD-associated family protein [Solirubrobacterales bacterium]
MAEREPDPEPKPTFFSDPAGFRAWLAERHASEDELYVGFYKKATGKQGLSWADAVDEALCFGWIDGRRNRIDDERHMVRFTPRRKGSNWSRRNIARVQALEAEGRMRPAGRAAYEAREADRSGVYSFERGEDARLEPEQERRFRADAAAWEFFESQPPGYRRTAIHLVTSAKRPETRERRLDRLIADSAAGLRIKELRR